MKKAMSKVMGLIISLIIGLFVLLFILSFVMEKISFLSHTSDDLIQINDPERLTEQGIQYYYDGDFESAIKSLDRAIKDDKNYKDIYKAKLMLGLSYAANSDFSEAKSEFEALSKELNDNNLYPETQSVLNQITSYIGDREFGRGRIQWDCCNFRDLGYIYAYRVCEKICAYSTCNPSSCSDVPIVVNP